MDKTRQTFVEWLTGHARGTLNDEATAALADVVGAVSSIGKVGKVTLEIEVAPAGSGGRTVVVAGRVKTKLPEAPGEASIFYVGDGGSLHRDDPLAVRLPGMTVEIPAGEARRVDPDTGEIHTVEED